MIIGHSKYSKDPSIQPDGIALTLPVQFFYERGMTIEKFKPYFERLMRQEDQYWNFKLKNLPTIEVPYVYFLFGGFFQYRLNLMCYERGVEKWFSDMPDGEEWHFPKTNWVLATGPVVKPPYEMPQKGFQGFRYTTKLF